MSNVRNSPADGAGAHADSAQRSKRVTIVQIAEQCGVSAQTVSRVLNGRPDVAPATRQAVEAAMELSGYNPSALARGLVRQRSQMIGVVVGGLDNIGVSRILYGIAEQAQSSQYGLLLREIGDRGTPHMGPVIDMLVSHQVEGIIFATPATDWTLRLADEVPEHCPPAIFVKRQQSSRFTTIGIDNVAAAQVAVQHLLVLDRRRIAHISGPGQWLEARHRRIGWETSLAEAGLAADLSAEGDWSVASGRTAMRVLLERDASIDAVFVANDQMALGALREANDRGIRIPEDIAVVGFDGLPEGDFSVPSLTTVEQPLSDIGTTAVTRLLREIDGSDDAVPGENILVPTSLVVRESAPLPHR